MVHNNGNPLPTDMFEKKQGNELFAVLITDEDGVQTPTYYFSNSKVLMDDTLEEIVEDLSSQSNENKGARVVGSNYVSRIINGISIENLLLEVLYSKEV